jgi:hypothetical protein
MPYSSSKTVCCFPFLPPHIAPLTPCSTLQSRRSSSLPTSISQSPFIPHLPPFTCSDSPVRLNSTLSIRIEELNAQISALHVENLRLRASEIALGSQLKKEREKSQRIITDAESAVSPHFLRSFISHFSARSYFSSPAPTLSFCYSVPASCPAIAGMGYNRFPFPADTPLDCASSTGLGA